MARDILSKTRFLLQLEKDGEYTAAPVSISSAGYMNPMYSKPKKLFKKKKEKTLKY